MDSQKLFFSAAYARLLARGGGSGTGFCSRDELLVNTGLAVNDLQQLDYLDWPVARQMLVNIRAAGAPRSWPLQFARRLALASHGPMGFTALSAPTLGLALKVFTDYHPTRIATIKASLQRDPAHSATQLLVTDELTGDAEYGRQVLEIALQVTLALIEAIVGHSLGSNVEVRFTYSRPRPDFGLEKSLGVRCRFGGDRNCIAFPSSWLHIASPLYDKASYHSNLQECREQMAALLRMQANTVEWIRQRLARSLDQALVDRAGLSRVPDLTQCADELYMSPRSLGRRLAEHNTAFSVILADVRREYAVQLLETSYLPVAEIALLLGYADPANFIRAFRSWCGCTPTAWRKGLGEDRA